MYRGVSSPCIRFLPHPKGKCLFMYIGNVFICSRHDCKITNTEILIKRTLLYFLNEGLETFKSDKSVREQSNEKSLSGIREECSALNPAESHHKWS